MSIIDLVISLSLEIDSQDQSIIDLEQERKTLQNSLEAAIDENGMLRNELSKLQSGERKQQILSLEREVNHLRQRCQWLEDRRKEFHEAVRD